MFFYWDSRVNIDFRAHFMGVRYTDGSAVTRHSNVPLAFTYWASGQPDAANGDCVVMAGDRWKMADCDSNRRIFCAVDAYGKSGCRTH